MSNGVDSSGWTGPFESGPNNRGRWTFTHHSGQHGFASDYERFYEAERAKGLVHPELRPIIRLAVSLVFSPAVLWLAWFLVHSSTRDLIVQDNVHLLLFWGSAAVALGLWQLSSTRLALISLRKALLILALAATVGVAGLYGYVGIKAHADATVKGSERAFVIGDKDSIDFQRADGSTVLGSRRRQPLQHGQCVGVVVLEGDLGFTWARIVEWVPRQRHQLFWPVRREDCFSDKPLASFAS